MKPSRLKVCERWLASSVMDKALKGDLVAGPKAIFKLGQIQGYIVDPVDCRRYRLRREVIARCVTPEPHRRYDVTR